MRAGGAPRGPSKAADADAVPIAAAPGRRRAVESAFVLVLIGALVGTVYVPRLGDPLVYDSAAWFATRNLPALGAWSTTDRVVSRQFAHWLYRLADGRMAWFRAVHLGLHAVTAWVLFLFLRRLVPVVLGDGRGTVGSAFGPALAAAVLFALHPVQVYAVTDPGQLELVLATLFALLLLWGYLAGLVRADRTMLLASALLYPLAVLSKENVVAVPGVAAALTLLLRRPSRDLVRLVWPWYALVGVGALLVVVAEVAQHQDARVRLVDTATARSLEAGHVHLRSAITQGYLFFRYLLLWGFPDVRQMSIDLHVPQAGGLLVWPESVGFAAFCLFPVVATALLLRRGRLGMVGFGLLWAWLLFLPELATTRLSEVFVLYRGYPWIAGPLAAGAGALFPFLGRLAVPALCAACVALGGLAYERALTFRSLYTVWDDAVRKNQANERSAPGAFRPYHNRGGALLGLGNYADALRDFTSAVTLHPTYPYAHFNRALAYMGQGRHDAALAAFDAGFASAAAIPPRARASALSNRADLFLELGRRREALADFELAAALDPDRSTYRLSAELLRGGMRDDPGPRGHR